MKEPIKTGGRLHYKSPQTAHIGIRTEAMMAASKDEVLPEGNNIISIERQGSSNNDFVTSDGSVVAGNPFAAGGWD